MLGIGSVVKVAHKGKTSTAGTAIKRQGIALTHTGDGSDPSRRVLLETFHALAQGLPGFTTSCLIPDPTAFGGCCTLFSPSPLPR